jgi:hypothetical protein
MSKSITDLSIKMAHRRPWYPHLKTPRCSSLLLCTFQLIRWSWKNRRFLSGPQNFLTSTTTAQKRERNATMTLLSWFQGSETKGTSVQGTRFRETISN